MIFSVGRPRRRVRCGDRRWTAFRRDDLSRGERRVLQFLSSSQFQHLRHCRHGELSRQMTKSDSGRRPGDLILSRSFPTTDRARVAFLHRYLLRVSYRRGEVLHCLEYPLRCLTHTRRIDALRARGLHLNARTSGNLQLELVGTVEQRTAAFVVTESVGAAEGHIPAVERRRQRGRAVDRVVRDRGVETRSSTAQRLSAVVAVDEEASG